MTLDSLPDLDTSGLCLVKTLSTALTCWPSRNTALRDGARTSTRTSSVAKARTASIHCRPAPPRQTEALSSRTSRSQSVGGWAPSVWRFARRPRLHVYFDAAQTYMIRTVTDAGGVPGYFCHVMVRNDGHDAMAR